MRQHLPRAALWATVAFVLLLLPFAHACPTIGSPGEFTMGDDYVGAPNPIPGGTTCVSIGVSNVVFNCASHTITNNGTTGDTTGIQLAPHLTNVTIENCDISGYTYAISVPMAANSTFSGNTVHNSTYGFITQNSGMGPAFNHLTGNTAYNCSGGFALFLSTNDTIANNTAYNSGYGFLAYQGGQQHL